MGHVADSITYLVSTQFQVLLLLPITRPKIPALYCKYKKTMKYMADVVQLS